MIDLLPPELLDYATLAELAIYEQILRAELADIDDGPALTGDIDLDDPPATSRALAAALTQGRELQRPHLDLIDQVLTECETQGRQRIIINVGPRYGKTRALRWAIMHRLMRRPETRIIYGSYGKALAHEQTRWVRDQLEAHDLGVRVRQDTRAADRWYLDGYEGGMLAAGIGSGITGFGADLLVVDDVIADDKQAQSQTWREAGWRWFTQTAFDRLEPGASVVIVMTRWHAEDLAGKLLAEQPGVWTHIRVPTVAEADDVIGRRPGVLLWPERYDETAVAEQRRTLGAHGFAARHQQRPSAETGDVWQRAWWRFYDRPLWSVHPHNGTFYVAGEQGNLTQSWDMAFKNKSSSDWVVGQVWYQRGADVFLLEQIRKRLTFTETVAEVRRLKNRWPQTTSLLVEDKANGTAVIDTLQREIPGMIPVNPTDSKTGRARAVSPFIESGNVHLPKVGATWSLVNTDELIDEAATFPNGSFDDQVDATSQALERLLKRALSTGGAVANYDLYDDLDDQFDLIGA